MQNFFYKVIFEKLVIVWLFFIPPAVENAVPPINMSAISNILPVIDIWDKSINWNPVVVDALTTWNTEESHSFPLIKAFSYAFSGFSIIVIGYILINIFLNYPPKMIKIFP